MIDIVGQAPNVILSGYQVTLEPLAEADIMQLRAWRNSDFIRQKMVSSDTITEAQQRAWFSKVQADLHQTHWIVRYKGKPIGATNLKTLADDSAASVFNADVVEPGLYIGDPAYQGNILAFAPTLVLYDYCFDCLKINALQATVKADNRSALNYNEKLGYETVTHSDDGHWVTLRITHKGYEEATSTIKRFLSR
ncbi:GNAT family N-acetyltransferase [Alteromonas sp. H39]|uniref:GNAT family N-acetyltransferase n=1 Tax=Alteromonas sp. H39 TaxID=3389876 RepID=UPI0039E17398